MASSSLLDLVKKKRSTGKWQKAMDDIFYFIEHYVPKKLFDLKIAAPKQLEMFKTVNEAVKINDTWALYLVIRAPRKGGKTICVAIVAVWLVLRDQTYRVFILSGSQNQAEWLYEYCVDILEPDDPMLAEFFAQFIVGEVGKSKTKFKLGGFIMYAPASEKQVNAPTADCLIMDEYVLIPTNIVEEAWPMVRSSKRLMRMILSTATSGKSNTESFLDLLDEAEKFGFQKFEWLPEDCPFLQTNIARGDSNIAKLILSEEMYVTQYRGGNPRRAGRIFPRTHIREAFVGLDPDKPGYLKDGTPFELDVDKRIARGEAKGGIDWGFEHDTVLSVGYRALGGKMVLMRLVIGSGTSPSDWANTVEELSFQFGITDWFADAAGAFQNQEIKDRGIRVVKRAFQHQSRGKEWMIGITQKYLRERKWVIPDIEEFHPLKEQLRRWRRDVKGKPKKGNDHCNDSFLCLNSGYNPTYYDSTELDKLREYEAEAVESRSNKWDDFASGRRQWLPESWNERELTRYPWEK